METGRKIVRMNEAQAREYVNWEYPQPYDFYTTPLENREEALQEVLDGGAGEFYAVLDENGCMVGMYEFTWQEDGFEIGLGLAPDYAGCGLGEAFVREGIVFAQILHPEKRKIVLDVLRDNERAIKVYERVGFVKIGERDAISYGKPIVFATMQLIV